MLYQRNEHLEDQLLDELMAEIEDPSRKDQHPSVTDLIYCLTKSYLDMKQDKIVHTRQTKLFFTIGLGLEKAMLVARRDTPTNGQHDGIWYHLDSLDHDNLIEFKSTRVKAGTEPEKLPEGWMKQIKSYLKTQGQTKCSLVVLHIIQPEIICWDIEFSQEEIDEQWAWLQNRKAEWEVYVGNGEVPRPFTFNEPWECLRCSYKFFCDATTTLVAGGYVHNA